ncbi:MAG: NAD(P)H-dependent oxidoreductase [Chlamydiae bacterium]|nr:NAD(P)H-dependent oxidoreductase [Chlamydiota bacterium]
MSRKKIVILCGSPRRAGNTRTLAEWAAEGARKAGVDVELIDLTGLRYAACGCTSCYGCQRIAEYRCVLNDEASELLARLPAADALVIATPIYFFGPSAQTKVFLDRCFSLAKFDEEGNATSALKGKTIALIASAGGEIHEGLKIVEDTFRIFAEFVGGPYASFLAPRAPMEEGALARDAILKEKATAFGATLASSL